MKQANGAGVPAVELRNTTKTYPLESGGEVKALRQVSLAIAPGEFVCILGPSGHGKSTLMSLIAGFIEPTSGDLLAGGSPVDGPGADRGVVLQQDTVFGWRRVEDNIGFGLRARGVPKAERERVVAEYLKVIGLEGFARAWPRQLSGGMRRRVAIATVFANDPEVLLMDEPFTGLDWSRRRQLHAVLLELWRRSGTTVVFITHDIDEALALADRVVVLFDGQIKLERRISAERPRTPDAMISGEIAALRGAVMEVMALDINDDEAPVHA